MILTIFITVFGNQKLHAQHETKLNATNHINSVIANDDLMVLDENTTEVTSLISNDIGLEEGVSSLKIIEHPKHGKVDINDDFTVIYTPERNFKTENGIKEWFRYRVCNFSGACGEATVSVYVDDVDYHPQAVDDFDTVPNYAHTTIDFLKNDIDIFDEPLSVNIDPSVLNSKKIDNYTINSKHQLTVKYSRLFWGTDTIEYEICDKENHCSKAYIYINVTQGSFGNFPFPQAMTPNNDGYNDKFYTPELYGYNNIELIVFNSWGNVVFESSKYDNNWDGIANTGTNKGKLVPQGTYYYLMKIEGMSDKITGFIQIVY
ncbi:MAG: gliding motility-associated C-terminal domain-containing protein [Marinilabiliaceae bacterium]|nr:gliding motility-associated C-terminal domain-containing protein [Marinilabiliaceae bacterium]